MTAAGLKVKVNPRFARYLKAPVKIIENSYDLIEGRTDDKLPGRRGVLTRGEMICDPAEISESGSSKRPLSKYCSRMDRGNDLRGILSFHL